MVAFNNTFTANVSPAYRNCVIAAEQFLSAQWINPVTINLTFDAATGLLIVDPSFTNSNYVNVSYAALRSAFVAHGGNNPDALAMLATLPVDDPTTAIAGPHLWTLPQAYARMLGFSTPA